jgi:hypothetical protein
MEIGWLVSMEIGWSLQFNKCRASHLQPTHGKLRVHLALRRPEWSVRRVSRRLQLKPATGGNRLGYLKTARHACSPPPPPPLCPLSPCPLPSPLRPARSPLTYSCTPSREVAPV